ncbi:isochorismatase family protein [Parvibaculum sedimenti]|uniref:Isochorismatase family protein n=1 Tax=Parvibaculum sedimenti TaxID=2608632 RepID=A0A6N6VP97_9HYPH|nr:isochorismatase family cysteine hydrolase [Parvibaculum sedimenti]KAB7741730.1 isochorismatase family protein [Parvibaculum sedimenti]
MPIIAAKPYDYSLPLEGAALIVIDMQRDFLEPGGFGEMLGNDVSVLSAIVPTVKNLLDAARNADLPIIHTREGHRPDMSDCPPSKRQRGGGKVTIGDMGPMGRILIRGEAGHDIVPELAPRPGEVVLDKSGKGSFHATDLGHILANKRITHLIFAGVTTEVCVQTTMREANDRGFECLLAEDATESYYPGFKQATLDMVRAQGGIVGWTATTDQIVAALAGVGV